MFGYSFGGVIALKMGIDYSHMFKAIVSVAPALEYKDCNIKKSMWILKTINFFAPKYKIDVSDSNKNEEF